MRKIKVVVLLVRQLQHGFTKNAKVSPNLTDAHFSMSAESNYYRSQITAAFCYFIAFKVL